MTYKSTKICAGLYEITDGTNVVRVEYMEHLRGWMAISEWDRSLYTDQLDTKKDAVHNARHMLEKFV